MSLVEAFVSGKKKDEKNFVHLTSVDYFINTTENSSAMTCGNSKDCRTWMQDFEGIPPSVILADIDDYLSKTDKKNDTKYEKYFRQKLEQIKKDLKISKNENMDTMFAKTKNTAIALKNEIRKLNISILSEKGRKALRECYDSCYTAVNQNLSPSDENGTSGQSADKNILNSLSVEQKAALSELKFLRKEKDKSKLAQYDNIRRCVEHEM